MQVKPVAVVVVVFTGDLNLQIAGQDIIVIEDIVDTGLTIKAVCAL